MNESEASRGSLFASRSVGAHLARGLGAAGLGFLALHIHAESPVLALGALLGAVVLLRGCPMCWTLGLVETVLRRTKTCAPCAAAERAVKRP